ncbi:MAG: hypothetical protein IT369_22430, partial [Candidatus Latescibacteria bacterium]|nr:hypothetical protein [Candidatus Latescibacterota bacterium]
MAVLVWYVDPMRLWASLNALKGKVFWASITLGVVGIAVQLAKWQLLLRRFRPATTWAEGFRSLLAGFGLGLLSPGRMGELGRGVVLGGKQATWIGLSVVDRASSATVT